LTDANILAVAVVGNNYLRNFVGEFHYV
jgi:hypothetical protein